MTPWLNPAKYKAKCLTDCTQDSQYFYINLKWFWIIVKLVIYSAKLSYFHALLAHARQASQFAAIPWSQVNSLIGYQVIHSSVIDSAALLDTIYY